MDLASRDSYMQKFASKIITQRDQEPKKRPFAHFKGKSDSSPPKKKKKCKKKHFKEKGSEEKTPTPKSQQKTSLPPAAKTGPAKLNGSKPQSVDGAPAKGGNAASKFSTVDILRKRLHEKIEESRDQGAPKNAASEAVQAKRAKRKLERERKKRKRKEFRMKELAEKNGGEPPEAVQEAAPAAKPAPASKRSSTAIIFNTVETVEAGYADKTLKRKEKKQRVKGEITPLTGKNYKQLLGRVEARKAKLAQLREKDEGKARQLEEKIKWTNLLYKAEGLKIKDDEALLRSSLRRKEKRRAQRKKSWSQRSEGVVEKMQHRQEKRRTNILRRKQAKAEKKKEWARKRGRVLPEDLKKAAV